jgi:hypothetical protein
VNLPFVFFDESLSIFSRAIIGLFGEEGLKNGVVLRDARGRLGFVTAQSAPSDDERERLSSELQNAIGHYARPERSLVFSDDPGAQTVLEDPTKCIMHADGRDLYLIDRRIVGSAWLESPSDVPKTPPRIVFASLKGGVGRSTAIAIAAADFARRNKNVLVIDLDLEAPGVGTLLLDGNRIPRFGVIDYMVETGVGNQLNLDNFVGTSALTASDGGRVDVAPAFGSESLTHPKNILAKLSRSMIESVDDEGELISLASQFASMVDAFTTRNEYDVVLIDSRAGLSELAAPAVLGLGAHVLFFGTAQYQTVQGYRALFAGLRILAERDRARGLPAEWRSSFKPVYAKASFDERINQRYTDDLYELFSENLYDESLSSEISDEDFSFSLDDETAPHWPLVIPFSQPFSDFDPQMIPKQLTAPFYEQTFRPFLNALDRIIFDVIDVSNSGKRL